MTRPWFKNHPTLAECQNSDKMFNMLLNKTTKWGFYFIFYRIFFP